MTIPQREGKENAVKHMPTPWEENHLNFKDANGKMFAGLRFFDDGKISFEEAEETIAFIVKSVNSHESLIELLKSAYEIIKKLEYSKPDYDGIRDECNFCNECEYTNRHSADCCVGKWLSDYERAIRGE